MKTMLLPTFDLKTAIEETNKQEGTSYLLENDFGFEYFNAESLREMNETLQYLNQGIDSSFFSEAEKVYIKQRNQQLEKLKVYCQNKSIEKPNSLVEDERLHAQVHRKEIFIAWQNYHYQQLTSAAKWQQWQQTSHATELARLKKSWERHQALACHTQAAIEEACELLPLLLAYCQKAKKSLRKMSTRSNLPMTLYKAFNDYLNNLHEALLAFHQQLLYSMLARLEAYDEKQEPVINHILGKLSSLGADITYSHLPPPACQDLLTDQQFNAFQNYIARYGTAETQAQLYQLSWFKASTTLPCLKKVTATKQLQLIPESFQKDIPPKRRSPAWFFKGTNLRHDFFTGKLALLSQLQKAPAVVEFKFSLDNPAHVQLLLDEIRQQENLASNALQELTQAKYPKLSPLLQKRTIAFLNQWKSQLEQHRLKQIENKILLAEKWSTALVDAERPLQAAVYQWSSCQQLHNLIKEIKQKGKDYKNDDIFSIRLKAIEEKTSQIFILNRVFQAFQTLASQQPLAESEWYYLTGHMQFLEIKDPPQYQALLALTFLQRSKIVDNLSNTLKTFFTPGDAELKANKIACFYAAIAQWGDAVDKNKVAEKLQKFFLRYLDAVLKGVVFKTEVTPSERIEAAESLLATLGKQTTWAGETLAVHIAQLKELKDQPVLLKCKCLSLMNPLAEKFLEKRCEKDALQLDRQIEAYLLSQPTLGYGQSHIKILMAIRDQAVRENKLLDELIIKPSEQVLVGLAHAETAFIKPLIEASIQAQKATQQIKNKAFSLSQKLKCVDRLNQSLQATLASTPVALVNTLLQNKTQQRKLFTHVAIKLSTESASQPDYSQPPLSLS